jgi:endogenous inhibitor of DNA gyrase (YacG/DUF329 family)
MPAHDPPNQSCTLFQTGATTCAVCGVELPMNAAAESPLFPFCSRRCKQIDLLRWTQGKYAITEPLTLERLLEEQARTDLDQESV